MRYLKPEEILVIHSEIIELTGGAHGIRDLGLFISLTFRPQTKGFGKQAHPGIWQKAAAYLESIAQYHVFIDGNKRTAFVATSRFLFINKYQFDASSKEVEKFMLEVANNQHDLKAIAAWLKKHSRKIR